jgi:hypothetical protein
MAISRARPPASPSGMTILTQLNLFTAEAPHLIYGPFISRRQAKEKRTLYYYPGTTCRHGHLGIRYASTGQCCECMSIRSKTDGEREKQRQRSKARAYTEEIKAYYRARHRRNNPLPRVFHVSKHSARIARNLRNRMNLALSGINKTASTEELLGCSFDVFIEHLESQFKDGMSWDNRGRTGWHIDHIQPCASFDLSNPDQQRQCFHYTNMQPLWAADNFSKGSRIRIDFNQDAI